MEHTALLVMDMQKMLLSTMENPKAIIEQNKKAIELSRKFGVPVIYVVVGFNEGMHEIHPENKSFGKMLANKNSMDSVKWREITEELPPSPNDPIVVKKRYSAFTGSDLELILRSKNIKHIVLSGIVTSGVVLSTYTEAADKDYKISILSDACRDRDDEVHQLLIEKIFPRSADVLTVAEWQTELEK